jgi:ABC-type multidrug transport system ATPase subunit
MGKTVVVSSHLLSEIEQVATRLLIIDKGKKLIAVGVEQGGNVLVPGLQLGTSVMEMRARRAAEAETRKALELGAGTKQTGKTPINNLNNP